MFNLLILDGDWEDEAVVQTGPVGGNSLDHCFNLDFNSVKY